MENIIRTGINASAGSIHGGHVEAVKPAAPLGHALTERMLKSLEMLFALANSLENAADRLTGAPPAKAAGTNAQITAQSHAGKLDMVLEGLETLNGSLSESLSRIERFI